MKKYILAAATVSIIALSCQQNKNTVIPLKADTANTTSEPPPIVKNDAGFSAPALSTQELKDDTVFTDGSVPTSWQNAGITDVKEFKLFLKQLQLWVMDNDKQKLVSVVKYPLKNISSPEELAAAYDAVFTKKVKLSFATINFSQVFRNAKGAMTDGGKVWFAQQGKSFKITAVNN